MKNPHLKPLLRKIWRAIVAEYNEDRRILKDATSQFKSIILDTAHRWRRDGLRYFIRTHKFAMFTFAAAVIAGIVHSVLLAIFVISFLADAFVVWTIKERLVKTLNSVAWYEIFLSKLFSFLVTGMAVYLIIYPTRNKRWGATVVLIWFIMFAVKRVFLALGFSSMSNDLVAVLASDSYTEPLPAQPPPPEHAEPEPPAV